MHCWWECGLVQPLWRTVRHFLRKLKMELHYDPAIPLLGTYLKKPRALIEKNICILMFTAASLTIAKIWKQPKCPPADEWVKKLWYIYTMEFYMVINKKEILPFATDWLDLDIITLCETSQSDKNNCHMISLTYGI